MGEILVVANQTLGGEELDATITDRVGHGHRSFHVLVPLVTPEHEVPTWAPADPTFGVPASAPAPPGTDPLEEARQRSLHRLDAMLTRIRAVGGTGDGEVGDHDPVRAVDAVLQSRDVDEIIVSTLPAGLSRWIRLDVASRIQRLTNVPVTRIEADAAAD